MVTVGYGSVANTQRKPTYFCRTMLLLLMRVEVSWDIYFYDDDETDENQMEDKSWLDNPLPCCDSEIES